MISVPKLPIGVVRGLAGNHTSIALAIQRLGFLFREVAHPEEVSTVERLILPGVGSFRAGMGYLEASGFADALKDYAYKGGHLLGICLGAQMLFDSGTEDGFTPGLQILPGEVTALKSGLTPGVHKLPIPHTGWNRVAFDLSATEEFRDLDGFYYFNHAHKFDPLNEAHTLAWVEYGERFPAAVRAGNVVGYQFHPEKSQDMGLELIRRFIIQEDGLG